MHLNSAYFNLLMLCGVRLMTSISEHVWLTRVLDHVWPEQGRALEEGEGRSLFVVAASLFSSLLLFLIVLPHFPSFQHTIKLLLSCGVCFVFPPPPLICVFSFSRLPCFWSPGRRLDSSTYWHRGALLNRGGEALYPVSIISFVVSSSFPMWLTVSLFDYLLCVIVAFWWSVS